MRTLELGRGHAVLVDDDDYERVKALGGWYVDSRGYAITDKRIKGKRTIIDMHRLIHPPSPGFVVDHINQNKLDNRKQNLRDATKSVNALNSAMWGHNTSGYKGVCWSSQRKKWRSTINVHGKQYHLGFFETPQEASRAYQLKLLETV